MAILNGVNTLDMDNGEITKVEYNGEVYKKVTDGIPKKGDIGLFKEKSWVHHENETTYVDILDVDSNDDPEVDKELGHWWDKDYLEYFRKEGSLSSTVSDGDLYSTVTIGADGITFESGKISFSSVGKDVATTLKAGDKVRIKRGGIICLHGFKDGDICEVSEVNHGEPRPLHLLSPGNKILGFATEDNVELVDEEVDLSDDQVKKEQASFDEGDIVVITDNTNGSRNKIGDIGVVGGFRPIDDVVSVDVPERPAGEYVQGNFTLYSDMRHATASEKADFERKHGDFGSSSKGIEKGDLVRVVVSPCALPIGSVFVVVEIDGRGRIFDPEGHVYREHQLELVEEGENVYV